ncbi:DUF1456 family protein [Anaerotalea alkaliphila]|uniref:DUF1456 family protein n=1 Tax=Anaerotalea alkaliphila TaxID=2662126 RepID=A0A7X5KNC2_9FIRM|nr:DUF1456 family protein [Anaerotalea alkaliphila]NDL67874.1 DUF1456 family protein [Anaerotalea alkaliphila]
MDNNDILIRLRYALDIKNSDMLKIFKLGGVETTPEELKKLLTRTEESYDFVDDGSQESKDYLKCTNPMLESFLNGLIVFRRGPQERREGEPETPPLSLKEGKNPNNLMLKKLKIALALTSEEMLAVYAKAGVKVTKGELGALLRNEGHKNYRVCLDKYARSFLKGLTLMNRK